MLAPFVLDLLIGCSLLILTGWMGDVTTRWFGLSHRVRPTVTAETFEHRGHALYDPCGVSGDRLFKISHPDWK